MTVTKAVFTKSVWKMLNKLTFNKGAKDDILTVSESFDYVEASSSVISAKVPGVENVNIVVAGAPETWTYNSVEISADNTTSDGGRTVTSNATDIAALPVGAYLLNGTTGEYFLILSKDTSANTFKAIRGLYGTTVGDIDEDDLIYVLNEIVLTSATTGYGFMTFYEMPRPGYTQDLASN